MVLACGLTMTCRPSPLPSIMRSASAVSVQMSVVLVVVIWLLSCAPAPLPGLPLFGVPAAAGAPLPLTRTSLLPWRLACR